MDHDLSKITRSLFAIAMIFIVPVVCVAQAPYAPPIAPQAPQVYYPPQPAPSPAPVQPQPPVATQPSTAPRAPVQQSQPTQARPGTQPQPGMQPQPSYQAQGRPSEYAFRPNLTNPEYGQCLNLEKRWQDLYERYHQLYSQARMMNPNEQQYAQLTYYLRTVKSQLDVAWNNFSSRCVYFPKR